MTRRLGRLLLAGLLAIGLAAGAVAQSNLNPDLGPDWKLPNGELRWPPNDGCADPALRVTLPPGTEIDRFGSEFGRFFATPGVSWEARALPYVQSAMPYAVYVVRTPLEAERCTIAAWFGAPGGGTQFKTADNVQALLASGVLSRK
ncbi:TNT domain-containing protein [Paracraurococcus ruber]|uniref:TNT domain-containing protein n=1 Tax=Paracraurococcus ruber TaxID=77675 RepID=A0ABS1D6E4_9PROT|nr:TNT domain-containing protein [Paracraurococcus ruber]MBK1661895.1 hypothetical protein [Paracraurococcus ruber]TDG32035.1 DUF4237 domain-containing protein [Paracraurococcus ruber]